MELAEKVRSILTTEFPPPSELRLEDYDLEDNDRVIGILVSPRFEDMDRLDRIHLVWAVLEKHLSAEELRRVLAIIAVSPVEDIVYSS